MPSSYLRAWLIVAVIVAIVVESVEDAIVASVTELLNTSS